jgi:hypothetical protein
MAKPNTDETDEGIIELKEKMKEDQERVTLALLIEASAESSFQFFFQTLYMLPVLFFNIYSAFQDQDQHRSFDVSSLFNWRNCSILLSFFMMSYSHFTIREDSFTFKHSFLSHPKAELEEAALILNLHFV